MLTYFWHEFQHEKSNNNKKNINRNKFSTKASLHKWGWPFNTYLASAEHYNFLFAGVKVIKWLLTEAAL